MDLQSSRPVASSKFKGRKFKVEKLKRAMFNLGKLESMRPGRHMRAFRMKMQRCEDSIA